ncbi:MAG: hypothetical protein VW443_04820 [Pseudomonadales bacterium]|jgi:hypothetical protein
MSFARKIKRRNIVGTKKELKLAQKKAAKEYFAALAQFQKTGFLEDAINESDEETTTEE